MILTIKISLLIVLALITLQDIREKKVSWVLFPITGLLLFVLYENKTIIQYSYIFLVMNIILTTSILAILFLYTRIIRKMKFLNVSFGLGDVLFFYAFALGFPTVTFLILFVSSIIFSLMVSLIQKKKNKANGIPLAGLMSLFLVFVFSIEFLPNQPSLYNF
ncbi:hypothetical protein SAMN04488007_3655 [Maribacter aquivivus]|uniref:Type IV leader peptidase family protein n=2 Tax=Maribacter aquivivus TaxID=228958 RepID=A0A1M6UIC2_9FLAO|nr:hypothetical protein SAMN04488007_3655 [Maribacter aquivivus]